MPHLLVAGKLHDAGIALLEDLKTQGISIDYIEEVSEESYAPYIHKADAMVIRTQPLSAATIAKADKLKIVSRHGVGYDAIDIEALNKKGIALAIVGDVNSISVAEHAMMQLLAASKRVLRSDRAVRNTGEWNWRNSLEQNEINGKNLLIAGYGRSGRHLAKMAKSFNMNVNAYDPYLEKNGWPEGDVDCASNLHEALAWADCLSLHVPKAEAPLIGKAELDVAKFGIVIANSARGGVIDENALATALRDGRVGAAGIDVFEEEPARGNSPLLAFDNVVMSPHIAGLTEEAAMRMAISSIENAMAYLDGTIESKLVVNQSNITN